MPAFATSDATPDMAYLLDYCPQLASFYDEVLRVTVDPIAVRVTSQEVTVGGKVLQPGRKVLAPFRQMHFDPEVYGANTAILDPLRFANNPKLQRSTSWRPFGGGNTHCPGRFIARREVYMFIAIVLYRFDVKLAAGTAGKKQTFPVLDTSIRKFNGRKLELSSNAHGHDIAVHLRPFADIFSSSTWRYICAFTWR